MGLGIREGNMVFLLGAYGVSGSEAVVLSLFSLIVHLAIAAYRGVLEAKNVLMFGSPAREGLGQMDDEKD